MNDIDINRLKKAANAEVIQRTLVKYFSDRGFSDKMNRQISPLQLQDIAESNIGLIDKVELIPHTANIDPSTGKITLGWNLFVLGNQRMYLGETMHENVIELAGYIKEGMIPNADTINTIRCTTPNRIIRFITKTLGNSKAGYVNLNTNQSRIYSAPQSLNQKGRHMTLQSQFFSKPQGKF